jgi:hypothetical protein
MPEATQDIEKLVEKTVNSTNGLDNEIRSFEGSHVVQPPTKIPESTKVEEPKVETPKAPEPSKVPDIKDFNKILDLGNTTPKILAKPTKDEGKTKQETTKADNANDDKTGTDVGAKTPEQINDEKEKKPERDLTGFSEREALYLRRMSYESYEHFSKELREAKALKESQKKANEAYEAKIKTLEEGRTVLPESYYENPQAIYLSPEFQSMQNNVQLAKAVEQHWADQLVKVKNGEDWDDLENDPKTGEPVIGKKMIYKDAADEVRITRYMNNSAQQTAILNNEVQQYVGQFKSRVGERHARIANVEKEMFPTFDNKESDEYKQTEAIKPIIQQQWGILPDNPAFNLLAKAVATGLMLKNVLTSMTTKEQVKNEVKQDQRKAGPTNNNFNGGGGVKPSIEPPTLDDFNKLLNR